MAFLGMMLTVLVSADIYLHNPAGSNNRNRERNANRNNANRLFDSQNNDKGGYPWRGNRTFTKSPDPLVYYERSILRLEWTNQHACGSDPTTHCTMVLQYACDDSLPGVRDGYPSGGLTPSPTNGRVYNPPYMEAKFTTNNKDGTTTISQSTKDNVEFGMHENYDYYLSCINRERNKGLYTADRFIRPPGAIGTRQQPQGTKFGFECNEERDYYPYWAHSPWRDIVVLTSDASWCSYYQRESQNVKPRFSCTGIKNPTAGSVPIDEATCTKKKGTWTKHDAWNTAPPDCKLHARSRQNHLGNVAGADKDGLPQTAFYDWTLPKLSAGTCVVRIRYNISTADYESYGGFQEESEVFNMSHNCGKNSLKDECTLNLETGRPLRNRPYITPSSLHPTLQLGVAINTDQNARTFQDRSHVFRITARPEHVKDEKIYNVNTRGKRGNIVQAYPAVEYDFVPQELSVNNGDYLHIQWSGSDFNTKRNPNDAEGWEYSDRHNLVQTADLNTQFPIPLKNQTFFNWEGTAKRFAWADSDTELSGLINKNTGNPYACRVISMPQYANGNQGNDFDQNDPTNCGKLNWAPARFDGGLMAVKQKPGSYFFTSTRNNNFSNRSPKWHLTIFPFAGNSQNSINVAVPVFVGLVVGLALIAAGVYLLVKFRSAAASTSNGIGKEKKTVYQSLLKNPTTESEQAGSDRARV